MRSSLIRDLDKIVGETSKIIEIFRIHAKAEIGTVAIFDQTGSTALKMKFGHDEAIKQIFYHSMICRSISKKLSGVIIKDTGDGILAKFKDPVNACLAALNIQIASNRKEISTKAALVLGMIEDARFTGFEDVYGSSIDLCARIEKCALPNQILINKSLHDAVLTFLKNYDDVQISDNPMETTLKGCGKNELYEISHIDIALKNKLKINELEQ